jgi:hypothetical protein
LIFKDPGIPVQSSQEKNLTAARVWNFFTYSDSNTPSIDLIYALPLAMERFRQSDVRNGFV